MVWKWENIDSVLLQSWTNKVDKFTYPFMATSATVRNHPKPFRETLKGSLKRFQRADLAKTRYQSLTSPN
jgi:hypothetical protein